MVSDQQLRAWYSEMLAQTAKAEQASAKWQKRREYLADYMQANAFNYGEESRRRDRVSSDWALQDPMDTWNWHRREANRLAQLVQAEWAFRQAGLYIGPELLEDLL